MKQRVITALSLLALLIVVVWRIYTPLFVTVVAIFAAVGANEIMKCAKVKNKFILYVGTAAAFLVPFFANPAVLEPYVSAEQWGSIVNFVPKSVYLIVLIIAFFLAMLKDYKNTRFEQVAISIVASIFVPFCFSVLVILRDIAGYKEQFGVYLIFYGLICALTTDIGAQLMGMAFGKHKMSPNISPKKTVEGAIGGIVFDVVCNLGAILLYNLFAEKAMDSRAVIILMCAAPFIGFLSMMGDLTASVLKRNFDVKDFGKIFPGHGGVMDRFDSSMFALPLTYCVALFILR